MCDPDDDTADAAWAQLECEGRHYNEWLAADPAYCEWLDSLETEEWLPQ